MKDVTKQDDLQADAVADNGAQCRLNEEQTVTPIASAENGIRNGELVSADEGLKRSDSKVKEFFSARRMAYIAVFTAISIALRFWQFPILTAVPFLQFDFSDAIVLICGYSLGPVSGVICSVLKELIYALATGFNTMGAGELANIIVTLPFLLITSIMYKRHKGIKSVILWLSVSCLIRTVWSIPVNYLLSFPVFSGFNWPVGMQAFLKVWHFATLFNLIKGAILSVVVMLLYKSISRLIHMLNGQFDKLHERNKSKKQKQQ